MNAVAPVWQGVALIRDEVTSTLRKAGQISVTAVMMADFKILRSAGFQRARFKLA